MAHVQKNNRTATGHLFDHYARNSEEEKYKYIYRKNDSIDPNRTHLNYNLVKSPGTQEERLNKRLSEIKVQKRKDINVMCSWVVTAPKDLQTTQLNDFFKETYNFLVNRYGGEKNVISAYVHMDETTPHLHFAFVPVAIDKKKNIEKLCAKEVINKRDLQTFHDDLQKHLNQERIFCSILNEATKQGNKSIKELKRDTAIEKMHENRSNELVNKVIDQLERELAQVKKVDSRGIYDFEYKERIGLFQNIEHTGVFIENLQQNEVINIFNIAKKAENLQKTLNNSINSIKTLYKNQNPEFRAYFYEKEQKEYRENFISKIISDGICQKNQIQEEINGKKLILNNLNTEIKAIEEKINKADEIENRLNNLVEREKAVAGKIKEIKEIEHKLIQYRETSNDYKQEIEKLVKERNTLAAQNDKFYSILNKQYETINHNQELIEKSEDTIKKLEETNKQLLHQEDRLKKLTEKNNQYEKILQENITNKVTALKKQLYQLIELNR